MSWQQLATERDFDVYSADESWVALDAAWAAAYAAAADIASDRFDSDTEFASGAQWITDDEWAALLEDAGVHDAVNDIVNDGIIAVAHDLGIPLNDVLLSEQTEEFVVSALDAIDFLRGLLDTYHDLNRARRWTQAQRRANLKTSGASPLSMTRAHRFARSQASGALNAGIHAGLGACSTQVELFADTPAVCSDIAAVRWVTQRDERVRPAHVVADTDTIPLGHLFDIDGYEARFPGDPRLPIGLRINCRCYLAWVDGTGVRRVVGATKAELYASARQLDIRGRSTMNKAELQSAVLEALCLQGLAGGPDCPDLFDQMNRTALMTYARQEKIVGRWRMTKPQLIEQLRLTMRGGDRIRVALGYAPANEFTAAQRLATRKRRIAAGLDVGDDAIPPLAARRAARSDVFTEFGGPERGYVPCAFCGLKVHSDPTSGLAVLVPTPIRSFSEGGSAVLANILPGCTACFQAHAVTRAALVATAPLPMDYTIRRFHLQGQHDQKTHGNRSGRPPDGAEVVAETDADRAWAEREGNARLSGDGDCYPTAAQLVVDKLGADDEDEYRLVHGVVTGQGDLDGVRFDHAWVEHTGRLQLSPELLDQLSPEQRAAWTDGFETVTVIDRSNGNNIEVPAQLFYKIGEVDPDAVRRYTPTEAAALLVDTEHYGPWEDE